MSNDAIVNIVARDQTAAAAASAMRNIENIGLTARSVFGAFGVGLTAQAFVQLGRSAIQYGSEVSDAATATGVGIEQLQALQYVAEQAGAGADKMTQALIRAQKSGYDASRGLSTTTDALSKLGIKVADYVRLTPEKRLEALSVAMVGAKDQSNAVGAVMDLLGTRNAPKLMEVLQNLAIEGVDQLTDRLKGLGLVMDEYTSKRLDAAGDAIERFKRRVTILTGETMAWWESLAKTGDAFAINAERVYSKLDPVMAQFSRRQVAIANLAEMGVNTRPMQEMLDAEIKAYTATGELSGAMVGLGAAARESGADLADSAADVDKYSKSMQRVNDLIGQISVSRASPEQLSDVYGRQVSAMRDSMAAMKSQGLEKTPEYADTYAEMLETMVKLDRVQKTIDDRRAAALKKNDELTRAKRLAINPDSEADLLRSEISALEKQQETLRRGTTEWYEKRNEILEKHNQLIRIQGNLEQRNAAARESILSSILGGSASADGGQIAITKSRGSRLMADYSSPDFAGPWSSQSAARSISGNGFETLSVSSGVAEGGLEKIANSVERLAQKISETATRIGVVERQAMMAR